MQAEAVQIVPLCFPGKKGFEITVSLLQSTEIISAKDFS
jgi:hypothetical protein